MTAWQEVLFGVVLMIVGLFVEDWIDQWRGRQQDATRSGDRHVPGTHEEDPA